MNNQSFPPFDSTPQSSLPSINSLSITSETSNTNRKTRERERRMEIRVELEEAPDCHEQKLPLLQDRLFLDPEPPEQNPIQRAISLTFQSTAYLANLLPTGTVLVFQLLSPVFSNQGNCDDATRTMTAALVALCGVSCFLLSFTDSFKDQNGNIYYGFATYQGLWVIGGSATLPPPLAEQYRIKFVDFMHAFMSVLVFGAVALFDENVVQCFYPEPSVQTKEVLVALPVGIGVICSGLFVVFPTTRHGIGFPTSQK
ncbi:hypothetical protein Nepgr_021377 [Nepenthes gracilis]|uniref:Uncharacterized protein n=1 Tax=Nepenthes gracilis TaxID=150966 RepID=A0AAD3T0P6_NEPGR|nr:hypothetical protein Nepgr_021377 [Nepenthes gracilis]